MDQRERQADRDTGEAGGGTLVCRAEDDDQEERGQQDLRRLLRTDELRVAYGRSEKPQELADSLRALADLLDRYQRDPDPKIAARRAEMLLDGQLAAKGRALAEQVLKRGSSEKAPRTATTHAEVDRWDGINLLLLEQLLLKLLLLLLLLLLC